MKGRREAEFVRQNKLNQPPFLPVFSRGGERPVAAEDNALVEQAIY